MAKLNVVIPAADVEVIGEGGVGTKYRKVERKAQAGDIVRITGVGYVSVEKGAFYPIEDGAKYGWPGVASIVDDDGRFRWGQLSDGEDWEVYEKVTEPPQPKRLTVGDYAKVIADSIGEYKTGAIIRITDDDRSGAPYKGVYADGTGPVSYLYEREVVPATEAEFLAQNRLKVGDYAKVIVSPTAYNREIETGAVVQIVEDDRGHAPYLMRSLDGSIERWAKVEHVTRATEAEVAAAREMLKYGDFTDGDFAQVVNATNANSTVTVQGNGGKYGKVTRHQYGGYGLKFTLEDGEYGSCKPDALRKVTREEYEAAVDPRNQFAKGDKVRLVSGGGEFPLLGFTNGDIYEVDVPRYVGHPSRNGVIKIKTAASKAGFATPDQLEKVSAEEVAEIEKWAAIGRKVGEFKRGDVVEVLESGSSGYTVGLVDTVDTVNNRSVTLSTGRRRPHIAVSRVKLIVPVEQRFDAA